MRHMDPEKPGKEVMDVRYVRLTLLGDPGRHVH